MPALAIRISIGCRAAASRNRRADGRLIRDIGHAGKMRVAGGNGFIQRRAIAAEYRDGRPRSRQRGRDFAADASAAAGDQRM